MIKFNSNNIIVGYIKELLHSFNLPSGYRPLSEAAQKLVDKNENYLVDELNNYLMTSPDNFIEGLYYLSNKQIYKCSNGKLKSLDYRFGQKVLNYTKNYNKSGMTYSSDLHEYLGDYLRFIRDYHDIDLMRMYNCFSNRVLNNFNFYQDINAKPVFKTLLTSDNETLVDSDSNILVAPESSVIYEYSLTTSTTSDDNYVIYSIPVKLGQEYTIAIECPTSYEIMCTIADKKIYYIDNSDALKELQNTTYQQITNSSYSKPFLYDKLKNYVLTEFTANYINNIKLLIKLPVSNKSSITVLEGNYTYFNNKIFTDKTNILVNTPQTIINYEGIEQDTSLNLAWKCQLLELNSTVSYPFADKLFEYLLDNVINSVDKISNNVELVQNKLFDSNLINSLNKGIWDNKYMLLLYEASKSSPQLHSSYDILGYVDKDIEYNLIDNSNDIKIIKNQTLEDNSKSGDTLNVVQADDVVQVGDVLIIH